MPDSKESIPHFTDAYYKARRSYAMYSGIFLSFELIGVQVKSEPFSNFKIELLSPAALPFVFLVLMLYYAIRYTIEWYQSDEERKKVRASKIDFGISHGIAIFSFTVYTFQSIADTQVFDANIYILLPSVLFTFFVVLTLMPYSPASMNERRAKRNKRLAVLYFVVIAITLLAFAYDYFKGAD